MEECGELVQIASKRLMYQTTEDHPDGKGLIRDRLADEIGDVTAAIAVVFNLWGLDVDRAMDRASYKEKLFREWFGEAP